MRERAVSPLDVVRDGAELQLVRDDPSGGGRFDRSIERSGRLAAWRRMIRQTIRVNKRCDIRLAIRHTYVCTGCGVGCGAYLVSQTSKNKKRSFLDKLKLNPKRKRADYHGCLGHWHARYNLGGVRKKRTFKRYIVPFNKQAITHRVKSLDALIGIDGPNAAGSKRIEFEFENILSAVNNSKVNSCVRVADRHALDRRRELPQHYFATQR
jgi:hypothetical protein